MPVYVQLPADLITPVMAYLRVSKDSRYSFLLESVLNGENIARYSFIGAGATRPLWFACPRSNYAIRSFQSRSDWSRDGYRRRPNGCSAKRAAGVQVRQNPRGPYLLWYASTFLSHSFSIQLQMVGGAIGYISYDSIQYFEPRTRRPLKDPLGIPEAMFMLCDTIIIYDHLHQTIQLVSHVFAPATVDKQSLSFAYSTAVAKARRTAKLVLSNTIPTTPQPPITLGATTTSNIGKEGYEAFVTSLKKNILAGDIIQAVPSQRLSRPTALHPFNAYRQLRQVNPSPYMFYLDCGDIQLVGASPETLCKVESSKVYNHAIAGTIRRGKTPAGSLFPTLSVATPFSNLY